MNIANDFRGFKVSFLELLYFRINQNKLIKINKLEYFLRVSLRDFSDSHDGRWSKCPALD